MKKVLGIIINVLAWVILIFALLVTIMVFSSGRNNGVANLLGFIPMTVESDSMKPTFEKDDFIICKEIDDMNTLKKGDVITFWTIIEGQRVKNTHRIVEVKNENGSVSYITRGDNNSIDDSVPVYAGDVIGEWTGVKVHGFGKAMDFLRTKKGFFICILIPMAIFFLFELYKFIVTLIEVKKPELSEDDEEEIKRRAIEEYLAAQKAENKDSEAPAEPKAEKPAEEETAAETTTDTADDAGNEKDPEEK
ncbi:MAG: signal peptidase I [Ruminococcus sp.]|nr:signal peptidase I [Ruminococcus sp.]